MRNDDISLICTDRNTILKKAHTEYGKQSLQNSLRFYRALEGTGVTPLLYDAGDDFIEIEYILPDRIPSDPDELGRYQDKVRYYSAKHLLILRKYGIIHSDLTAYNYTLWHGKPRIYDWESAKFVWEETPQKREGMDADHLYPSLLAQIPDTNRVLRRWLAISERIKHLRGYGVLWDLGTLYGDFVGFALSEGFISAGFDNGMFDQKCIEIAKLRWQEFGGIFWKQNILDIPSYNVDVILLLSTWSHMLHHHPMTICEDFLENVINSAGRVYFECQLYGDGPGPEMFKTDTDILRYLKRYTTKVTPIVTIDVAGRPFKRTVWEIEK